MRRKEFLDMVLEEATHLRNNATDEEKSNLDFSTLATTNIHNCIYGQMTGHCFSKRAKELFAKKFDKLGCETDTFRKKSFEPVVDEGFSPIEVYITIKGSKNRSLINYIKGKTNELKL